MAHRKPSGSQSTGLSRVCGGLPIRMHVLSKSKPVRHHKHGVRTYPAFRVVTPAHGAARRARQHHRRAVRVHLCMEGFGAPSVALRIICEPVL